jgi:ABC-type multidrug transport system fused ATPase/permease subunit
MADATATTPTNNADNADTGTVLSDEMKAKLLSAYKRMLSYQFYGAISLVALLVVGLLSSYVIAKWEPPLLILVMLAGTLGAFFSALTRLYNVDQLSIALISPTVSELEGRYLLMYSLVPPIIGAIASVVLYIAFVGGIIGGGIFPELVCKPNAASCESLVDVMRNYGPKGAQDYGKVLIWGFIAGFSERLVPDMLQTLVTKSEKDDQKK